MGRWLGIADEVTFGTPVTPPTDFRDCISIGLHPEREQMQVPSMATIGARAGKGGSYKIVGDIEIHPSSENIVKLLKYLFGAPTTTQDGVETRYKHEYIPSDTLLFGTMYKADDVQPDGANALQYTSVIVLSAALEAALNEPVSITFGCFGQKDAQVTKPTLGTIPTVEQFFSVKGKMYWDLTQTLEETNIDSVSLTYTRAISEDFYAMNDVFLKGFIPGEATLEGSVDLLFKSWDAYEKFWGATTAPVAEPALAQIELDFIGPTLGGTGDYEFHRMQWELPAVQITSIDDPFSARDKIMQTVAFKCIQGQIDTALMLCKVWLANTVAAP